MRPLASFIIRIRGSSDSPTITLQNVSTREVLTLTSWTALLEALQQPLKKTDEPLD